MADSPEFRSSVLKTYPTDDRQLMLTDVSDWAKVIVRADPDTAAAATLQVGFGSSRWVGDVVVCGQRPNEWMLLGTSSVAVAEMSNSLDQNGHVSIVDHTHSRALFRLTGDRATSVLEKLCSLDWTGAMTPDGAVVSASVAKVNCDVTRQDADGSPSYLVACDRSFGQYLFDVLLDAGNEFEIGVGLR